MSDVPDILSEIPRRRYFLGFDFSTQQVVEKFLFPVRLFFTLWFDCVPQLKAVVVDEELKVLHEAAVNFERNLPEYRSVILYIYRIMKC